MTRLITAFLATAIATGGAIAHEINSAPKPGIEPDTYIRNAKVVTDGRVATFSMTVGGDAVTTVPAPIGALPGAGVAAYVWPTSLDPEQAGFAPGSGILALAVTAHPDFDDTPFFDENGDGDPGNDGKDWHSHWVVLAELADCPGGFHVRDIDPARDILPLTAPGLPLALDSPGYSPILSGDRVRLAVPLRAAEGAAFDALTSTLQVNEKGEAPLLCVTAVHDIASGDLSMPGRVMKTPE